MLCVLCPCCPPYELDLLNLWSVRVRHSTGFIGWDRMGSGISLSLSLLFFRNVSDTTRPVPPKERSLIRVYHRGRLQTPSSNCCPSKPSLTLQTPNILTTANSTLEYSPPRRVPQVKHGVLQPGIHEFHRVLHPGIHGFPTSSSSMSKPSAVTSRIPSRIAHEVSPGLEHKSLQASFPISSSPFPRVWQPWRKLFTGVTSSTSRPTIFLAPTSTIIVRRSATILKLDFVTGKLPPHRLFFVSNVANASM